MQIYRTSGSGWGEVVAQFLRDYTVYAPYYRWGNLDYGRVEPATIQQIIYFRAKPTTPLKTFLLPVKERVTSTEPTFERRIVIGIPACDLRGLRLLDEIYLDGPFRDPCYAARRENTLLIACDCQYIQEHCHCTAYDGHPYPDTSADIVLSKVRETFVVLSCSERGEALLREHEEHLQPMRQDAELYGELLDIRNGVEQELFRQHRGLPGTEATARLVASASESDWERFAADCVCCGACTAACPTCTCFLLVDQPGFHKVRNLDACQYPGFERVAAGEDPLKKLARRFRNRYMCKYIWKAAKYEGIACTGCGRCIEACIGAIDKNAIFMELATDAKPVSL
jgi:sulfhydrogenase subunit beta (sulfur reductase)